jgi:hypothetical protein
MNKGESEGAASRRQIFSHAFVRSMGITLGIAGGLLVVLAVPALMVLPRLPGPARRRERPR